VVKGCWRLALGGNTVNRWQAVEDPVVLIIARRKPSSEKGSAQAGTEETTLVEGRRPGSGETIVFDEPVVEMEPGGVS